jgi:hypothetical protein
MELIDYLYKGTVELNLDPELKGRVKVRIENLFGKQVDTSTPFLPWAYPMINSLGGSELYGESRIPEKDSEVWVFIPNIELLDPIFYFAGFNFEDTSMFHSKFSTMLQGLISAKTIVSTAIYPDMKFTYLKNGLSFGHSSGDSSKEMYVYHPSGTIIYIEDSGKIQVRTMSANIDIQSISGDIKAKTTSGDIVMEATPGKIKTKGTWEHDGTFTATKEITANNDTTKNTVGKHTHTVTAPGLQSVIPTPNT